MARETDFPNLRLGDWRQCSDPDRRYNCIGFAAGRTDVYWWPDPWPDPLNEFWPAGITRQETVDAIAELYQSLGYAPCTDAGLELGYEKVAIYANGSEPTHAARQLPDGRWVSKLGRQEDIEHGALEDLAGPCYGKVVRVLRRPSPGAAPGASGAAQGQIS